MRKCWDQWIREKSFTQRAGSRRPRQNSRREDCHIVVFSVENRFNLSRDDNRVRERRPKGEHLNPAFALQHTTQTASVMIWRVIAYNTRSSLVLISGTMRAQGYVHGIMRSYVLPLMQRLLGAIFEQDNARPHTARVSQDCLCTGKTEGKVTANIEQSFLRHHTETVCLNA
ncbi:transposable element Tcb2 transposase [Trichonephila clavipes]|nr:transposable element Tcb2 transposase [Trichonephila clavipes]